MCSVASLHSLLEHVSHGLLRKLIEFTDYVSLFFFCFLFFLGMNGCPLFCLAEGGNPNGNYRLYFGIMN